MSAIDALKDIKNNLDEIGKYPITFCCIYKDDDLIYLKDMLLSLPENCEIILMKTVVGGLNQVVNAKRNGRKVYAEWHYDNFNYSAARNACKALATSRVIFSIDADERLLKHQNEELIKYALELDKSDFGGLALWVVSLTDRQTQYSCDSVLRVRIFKNNPEIRWIGIVHENVEMTIRDMNLKIGHSPILLHHIGYNIGINEHYEKVKERIELQRNDLESLSNDYFFDNFCNDVQTFKNIERMRAKNE